MWNRAGLSAACSDSWADLGCWGPHVTHGSDESDPLLIPRSSRLRYSRAEAHSRWHLLQRYWMGAGTRVPQTWGGVGGAGTRHIVRQGFPQSLSPLVCHRGLGSMSRLSFIWKVPKGNLFLALPLLPTAHWLVPGSKANAGFAGQCGSQWFNAAEAV